MKRRPRSKRISPAGGKGSTLIKLAVPLFLVGVVVLAGPSNLITAISLPRGSSSDVVTDPSSVVGLNTTHVGAGTNRELTTITNQFEQTVTVTLSLTGDSPDRASLYINGVNHGDTATIDSLASGENVSVNASVRCKDALVGQSLTYDIDVSGDGINGTIQDRSVSIEQYCLTWYTAADWDAFSLEHGVVHESFGDHDAADIELGYNTTDANLTAYWPLDEDSGSTASDATGNGHDGTITGASLGQTGILGTTAYDFDGTDDVVNVSSSSELRGGSTATISAAAWFKAEAASSGQPGIVGKQLDASNGDWGIVYTATCPDWDGNCGDATVTTPTLNNFTETGLNGGSSTYTYQHGHSNGSNQITLVIVLWNGKKTQEVSSVSYGGNSLNESTDAAFCGGCGGGNPAYVNAEIWYIRDADMPSAGSHTVQVNHPTSTGNRWLSYAYTYDGINQTSPFDNATNSSQAALSIYTNVSASSNKDALVSALVEDSGISVTWDYNETEKSDTEHGGFGTSTAWKLTKNGSGNVTTGASNSGGPTLQSLVSVTLQPKSTGEGGNGPYVGYYSEDGGNDYGLLYGKGIENGNWYHVTFVLDQANNNLYLYLDGRQVNKDESLPQVSASTSADVEIGGTTYSSDYFNGTIDEVRVYNRTLSDKEVAVLANGSDPYNTSAEWNGTHVTGWESTYANLSVGSLQLSDVVADDSGGTINLYVESDTDGDGSTEETSAGITVNSSTGPYDVTGLSTDSDRFRLRVELSTPSNTTSPCFSGATLSPGDGLSVGTRSGCGTTNATANQQPTANFTYTETVDNWYNDSWENRKEITIDHNQVSSDLSDFPVFINLSDSDLAADALNDGDDILFTAGNGTKLDHEIEEFNGSTGDLAAWVEVSQVNSTAPNTSIYMYYNNSGADNQENVTGVWSNGYRAVWHLSEPEPTSSINGTVTQEAMDGNNGAWANLYGSNPLDPGHLDLTVDEDQISDSERTHNPEQVGYWVFNTSGTSNTTIKDASGTVIGEFGVVSSVGTTFTTVNLNRSYSNPVVVPSYNLPSASDSPAVTRVRNVTGSSFEVRIQNPGGGSAPTANDVYYVVVEAGAHTLPGSVPLEAGTATPSGTNNNSDWSTGPMSSISPTNSYSNPVVLGQVMTYNDTAWSTFWSRAASSATDPPNASSIYVGKHVGEDDAIRNSEDVGYIIIEESNGTTNGIPWSAALGGDKVEGADDTPPFTYPLFDSTAVDSTANNLNGTMVGPKRGVTAPTQTGYSFDGSKEYVYLPDNFNSTGALPAFTVMAWVKVPSDGGDWSILDYDRSDYFTAAAGVPDGTISGEGGTVFFGTTNESGTTYDQWSSNTSINDGRWHLVAWVFDPDQTNDKRIYIDGALDISSDQHATGGAVGDGNNRYGYIGDGSESSTEDGGRNINHYQGDADNVRFSTTVRSSGWIATTYNNTNSPSSFVNVGIEETEGTVSFNASNSSDPDGSIQTYEWDFDDDGTFEETTTSPTTAHDFTAGDHPVTLKVIDDDSATHNTTKTVRLGIKFDAASSNTASSTSSLTFSHTIGSGSNRLLVVEVAVGDTSTGINVSDVTYNGVSLTKAVEQNNTISGNEVNTQIWYALDSNLPSSGTYTVNVSTATTMDDITAGAVSVTDAKQAGPEATGSNATSTTTISTSITTQNDGAWAFDATGEITNASATLTPDSGQTERWEEQAVGMTVGGGSTEVVTNAGTVTLGWTATDADRMSHVVVAFAPA